LAQIVATEWCEDDVRKASGLRIASSWDQRVRGIDLVVGYADDTSAADAAGHAVFEQVSLQTPLQVVEEKRDDVRARIRETVERPAENVSRFCGGAPAPQLFPMMWLQFQVRD